MSKTHRHKKEKGFLDHVANVRKKRKHIRDMKSDPMLSAFDISPRNRFISAPEF